MKLISGQEIANFLGYPLRGNSKPVARPAALHECGPGDLVWVRGFTEERLALLETRKPSLAICDGETAGRTAIPCIESDNPRLDFIRVLHQFFVQPEPMVIHPTALIDPAARIGQNVSIGPYSRIGPFVELGDGCRIGSGVSVEGKVSMGRNCVIKSNSVIGAPGFGFEYDRSGNPIHFPHIGRIVLEDDVWLGACTTIEQATLGTTRICRGCKVDDLVQIGHNSTIGDNTLVMANAVICGGAVVGKHCWIAPNSVIKEHVTLGDRVVVGLGAVVLKDVADGLTVAGVPAKPLH